MLIWWINLYCILIQERYSYWYRSSAWISTNLFIVPFPIYIHICCLLAQGCPSVPTTTACSLLLVNPFMPIVAFNICCPRDCVSRHNGGNAGAPLKPLRDDSALRALSTLRGLRGAPAFPPLCRETQSLGQQMLNATVSINGLNYSHAERKSCVYYLIF